MSEQLFRDKPPFPLVPGETRRKRRPVPPKLGAHEGFEIVAGEPVRKISTEALTKSQAADLERAENEKL